MTARQTALITGASSGIGAAVATLFAASGFDLILVARRADRLAEAATRLAAQDVRVEVLVTDLATADGLDQAVHRAGAGDIDVLVSNAGVGGYRPLTDLAPAEIDQLWRLNATAHIALARSALPGMLRSGSGGIITVASLLAFSAGLDLGFPRTVYVAAKAAAVAFTRMLAVELTGTGVTATVVCPGLVDTEWSGGINHRDPRAMPPDDVAQALWTAFQQNEVLCVPGIDDPDLIQRWTDQEPTLLHTGNRARLAPRYARTPAIGEPPGFS